MKKLSVIPIVVMLLPLLFSGCKDKNVPDQLPKEPVSVQFKATGGNTVKSGEAEMRSLLFDKMLQITNFQINIGEIEFDFADDDLGVKFDGLFGYKDDLELKGPFTMHLVSNGELKVNTVISGLNIPAAAYKGIEFELSKCTDKNSSMYNKSIRIEGKIGEIPFVFESDKKIDFEIDFDYPFVAGKDQTIVVNFCLDKLFHSSLGSIDLKVIKGLVHDGKIHIQFNEKAEITHEELHLFILNIWREFQMIVECDFTAKKA